LPSIQFVVNFIAEGRSDAALAEGFCSCRDSKSASIFSASSLRPEYLGNKIEAHEMKLVIYAILVTPFFILGFSMVSAMAKFALDSLGNGPHGLTEMICAYAATASDNGSAFGGLNANTPWFDRDRNVGRALSASRPDPRARWRARGKDARRAVCRNLPDARSSVRRPAGRDNPHRRAADLFPGAGAGPDRRALRHARRQDVLM
jgi:Potassium-transporting ATPase A subunit